MAYGANPSSAVRNGPSVVGSDEDDESFSRDLKEMLKDGVAASGYNAHVQGDLSAGMACIGGPGGSNVASTSQAYRPNSLPAGISGGYMSQAVPPGMEYMLCTHGISLLYWELLEPLKRRMISYQGCG
jgi:hypothetical protein